MNAHVDDEILFALAHGLLQADERAHALTHVQRCRNCEDRFHSLVRTREYAKCTVPADRSRRPAEPPVRRWQRSLWIAAAATAAVIGFFLGFPLNAGSPDVSRDDHFWLATDVEIVNLRTDTSAPAEAFRSAVAAYDGRELLRAEKAFRALEAPGGWADLRDVFLISLAVNTGDHATAEDLLEQLDAPTLPSRYRRAARWYRYVVLKETGAPAAARALLDSLAHDPGPVGKRARAEMARHHDSRVPHGAP
jgi:hypothetical protein